MTTAFFSHDDCMKHNMGPEHPESPERISTILAYLADTGLEQKLDWVRPEEATRDQLLTVHPEKYLQQLEMMAPTRGRVFTDPDTALMPDTLRAARLSAGANIQAVDMVMSSQVTNAFVCARPPGHHAERSKSMGFCFYNNIALAAMRALNWKLEHIRMRSSPLTMSTVPLPWCTSKSMMATRSRWWKLRARIAARAML